MSKKLGGTLLLVLSLLLIPIAASAQSSPSATLSRLNIDAFPRVESYLDVRDSTGRFIHGLTAAAVRILEDSSLLPVSELYELQPGAQIVMALNPGAAFSVRNSQGISRLDIILQILNDWGIGRAGSTLDDWSLVATGGAGISHVSNPRQWLAAINSLQIDPRKAQPSLDTLARALDLAADAPPRPGMGKAVLFITEPMDVQVDISFDDIVARAIQNGVRIFVWMVPVPGAYTANEEGQLRDMASKTGGQFLLYTDDQSVPDLESWWAPLRSIYRLVYQSQVKTSGPHEVVVEVQNASGSIPTSVQNFEINLRPPDPAFVSPPLEINRLPPISEDNRRRNEIPTSDYLPNQYELQALVAFPDERVRPLTRTSLFVDGQLVDENLQSPFELLTWDLTGYAASGTHMIRLEAEDSLGLVGTSMERLVQVNVELPARNPWSWVYRNVPVLSILVVVVAGSILFLVLLLGGRLHPRSAKISSRSHRRSDPVTQPVPVRTELPARHFPNWVNRLQWPQRQIAPQAIAFLSRTAEGGDDASSTPFPITQDEITLGSDQNQAKLVLNDPSVAPLHARLTHQEDGSFRLYDHGSIAGTWINYTPVSQEGASLEHGDLVHIGRVGFRFTLRQPSQVRRPVVTPVENPEEYLKLE